GRLRCRGLVLLFSLHPTEWQGFQLNSSPNFHSNLSHPVGRLCFSFFPDNRQQITDNPKRSFASGRGNQPGGAWYGFPRAAYFA
ncbi:MAG: hypothetical protein J0M04_04070, partial [Verrucomicrobia bacterium]|nr:hypothetical protein [Verrucomicrobiota bacterium]